MNTRWEDDSLWASDPAAEEVSRMLDAICPHCDGSAHLGECGDWHSDTSHENGSYVNICHSCGNQFRGHKRRVTCRVCWRAEIDRWCEAAKSWGTLDLAHDQRAEDVEGGRAMSHARPDDDEWESD